MLLTVTSLLLVDFVLKDPREKDDDKKEDVQEYKKE